MTYRKHLFRQAEVYAIFNELKSIKYIKVTSHKAIKVQGLSHWEPIRHTGYKDIIKTRSRLIV
jgi:hypothetical protein